ncbi:hypothetical protein CAPTEDRAFT_195457 [Capitella teleta]|uniref:Uncharacterized protein n=1 Tax=Capitella teleta TaxID=283909 RepID=R7UK91_CAPTE|nr:hypothetical protein CAPTEDRAFT_195457 [Capitella teleta]|eukprot:ELU06508.1 hypothetical protein CAPTEDRAFT_195457 [Capitella teleta]
MQRIRSLFCWAQRDDGLGLTDRESGEWPATKRTEKQRDFLLENIKIMERLQRRQDRIKERENSNTFIAFMRNSFKSSSRESRNKSSRNLSTTSDPNTTCTWPVSLKNHFGEKPAFMLSSETSFNLLSRPDSRSTYNTHFSRDKFHNNSAPELRVERPNSCEPNSREEWMDRSATPRVRSTKSPLSRQHSSATDGGCPSERHQLSDHEQQRSRSLYERGSRRSSRKRQAKRRSPSKQEQLDWQNDPFTAKYRYSAFAHALQKRGERKKEFVFQ